MDSGGRPDSRLSASEAELPKDCRENSSSGTETKNEVLRPTEQPTEQPAESSAKAPPEDTRHTSKRTDDGLAEQTEGQSSQPAQQPTECPATSRADSRDWGPEDKGKCGDSVAETNKGAAAPEHEQLYRLKDIQWRDVATGRERDVKIATQNENGPCPLLALANVLALSGKVRLGTASQQAMTDDELTGILANLLFDQQPSNVGDVSAVLSLLPLLHKGLDVDLRFSHIRDFAETANARLFAAFGVELVHGWVVDEQSESEVARVLGSCGNSYEGAVEFILAADELSSGVIEQGHPGPPDGHQRHGESSSNSGELDEAQQRRVHEAIALNEWLQATATQLTERGLAMLQADLGGDSLSVMFRNNHFSTLFRRADGQLFLLCTDDVVAADPRIVWESLSDVHQATSQFVDSRFLPLASGNHDGSEGGGGGGSSRGDGSGDKRREGDYARQGARYASREQEAAAQIDSDYAMALRLHEEERERDQQSQLQVRQQDRHPPGMDVKRGGNTLFNVPEVTREGETRLARAIHRTQSDENFDRQMQAAFLPNEAVRARPPRQRQQEQQQQHQQAAQDKCVIQ